MLDSKATAELTPREREVMLRVADGLSDAEIARALVVERCTVRKHLEHVYEKTTRGTGSVYDLVFSPDKDQKFIYMIDGMNGEVRVVDRATRETLSRFGRPGRQVGMFTALHNIAVDRAGNIYTSEVNTGQRVQKFRRLDPQD